MGHVSEGLLHVNSPAANTAYAAYLASFGLLGRGFVIDELVRHGSYRHTPPPRHLWARMVPTLALAVELRARMVVAGARGLRIAAAFRPVGGAGDSQHKHNSALDLDLLPGDERLQLAFARAVAELWREHEHLRAGVGTYAPAGRLWSNRVHLDTGYRFRCWQGTGSKMDPWADRPAALVLAPPDESDLDGQAYIAGRQPDVDCARHGVAWPRRVGA